MDRDVKDGRSSEEEEGVELRRETSLHERSPSDKTDSMLQVCRWKRRVNEPRRRREELRFPSKE